MIRLTVSESYCLAKECSLADKDGTCVLEISKNCYDKRLHDKLREYEDLEEQVLKSTGTDLASMVGEFMHYYNLKKENRLLELPCKVGDKLYKPYYYNRKAKGIDTIVVSNMVVEFDNEEGERAYIVGHYENTNCGIDVDFSEIGEVVHVHKAEAENMTMSALVRRSLEKVDKPITVNLDTSDLRDLAIQSRRIDSTVRTFLKNIE